ncbi:hypothetical protein Agub_g8378, partial [Astrephomene gubernaculifera]
TVAAGPGTYVSHSKEYKQEGRGQISGLLPLKLLGGFRGAIAVVAGGPTLTLDAAYSVVAEDGRLLPQLEKAFGRDLAQQLMHRGNAVKLEAALVGLKVKNPHNNITFDLTGRLTPKSARHT